MTGPELVTDRLVLRPHAAGDFEDLFAMWSDPDTTRHIGGAPSTRAQTWQRLLTFAGAWPVLGFGYWAVRERHGEAFVGDVGFADFHRGTDPGFDGEPEMGWAIAPGMRRRGYAAEAVRAALAWADATLPHPRIVCMIAPGNAPSIAIATQAGFTPWTETDFNGQPTRLFQRANLR